MLFSLAWLNEYVDAGGVERAAADEVAAVLTRVGFNVEGVAAVTLPSGRNDFALDADVTTNRPDAMCHFGLARELAAALGRPLRPPAAGAVDAPGEALPVVLAVDEPALAPRFVVRVIDGVGVGTSPPWLVDRLAAIGLRAINNVVDVTNFLLWELGQPQHAYDLDTLDGSELRVRCARAGESLVTLDGTRRALDEDMLLICDRRRAVGVAGVMGGSDTEVTARTRRVLLECALFEPQSTRRTARRLGLHTDASHRFERGVDPDLQRRAADRAAALIAEVSGGSVLPGVIDRVQEPHLPRARTVELLPARLRTFAGADLSDQQAAEALERLAFTVDRRDEERWRCTAPSWRAADVELSADLYEEVLRHYGFDRVPPALPPLPGADAPPAMPVVRRRRVREFFAAGGFAEAIHWAFHDHDADRRFVHLVASERPVTLANPLSELYAVMRRSLLPGLLDSARFNQRRGARAVRLFEVGVLFCGEEHEAVAAIGGGGDAAPWQRQPPFDYLDLKGCCEALAERFGARLVAQPALLPGLVPGASAWLYDESGERVGTIGQVDEAEPGPYPLFCAELLLRALPIAEGFAADIEAPSRFPGVAADLTVTHPLRVSWAQLAAAIAQRREAGELPLLVSFELKDRYRGDAVPDGAVNTTIACSYVSGERSLTRDEVNAQHDGLRAALLREFGVGEFGAGS